MVQNHKTLNLKCTVHVHQPSRPHLTTHPRPHLTTHPRPHLTTHPRPHLTTHSTPHLTTHPRPHPLLPSGQDGVLGSEAMDGAILQVESHDTATLPSLHQQIQSKILNEIPAVVTKGLERERGEGGEGVREGARGRGRR